MLREIVSTLPDTAVTSTISSRAVSGSITTVNVSPAEMLTPPSTVGPETTVQDESVELSAALSVVC